MPKHHYIKFGTGKEVLLCFHGYEQDLTMFDDLDEVWQEKYTIYAFDLMHHGKSVFPMDRVPHKPFEDEEIRHYFHVFFEKEKIDSFQLMGYSLGARMALYLASLFTDRIEGMYLFAPDGFKKMPLQNFIEHNKLGVFLFGTFVKKPIFFHASVKFLRKGKIIRQRLHDFVIRKTANTTQREQLYNSWQTYKNLHLPKDKIDKVLENIPNLYLVFGKKDAVIPPTNLEQYKVRENQLILLDTGHDLFDDEALKTLRSKLNF